LVEVWQFKYEKRFKLKASKKLSKTHLEVEKSKEHPSRTVSVNHSDWLSEDEIYEPSANSPDPNSPDPNSPSFSTKFSSTNQIEVAVDIVEPQMVRSSSRSLRTEKFIEFLESMPWRSLPLAHSISSDSNNKWKQCSSIFLKYLDKNAYDAVNVSHRARNEINSRYGEIFTIHKVSGVVVEEDKEFEQKVVNVFDGALEDIVHNLRDSMMRFVRTEQFKMTSDK